MPKLSMSVPHSLGQEEASQRLKQKFSSIKETYKDQVSDLEEEWNGNVLNFRFTTYGVTIKGDVTAAPSDVKVKADLPMVAMMLKGTIERQISEQLGKLLA